MRIDFSSEMRCGSLLVCLVHRTIPSSLVLTCLKFKYDHDIGIQMRESRTTVPTEPFGRPPRDVAVYNGSFKAAEWSSFLLYYSIPLLHGRMPERYLYHWRKLLKIWEYVCRYSMTKEELVEVEEYVFTLPEPIIAMQY